MAKKTKERRSASAVKSLARKYEGALRGIERQEHQRLTLAKQLYDIARSSEDCEIEIHEHPIGSKRKPVIRHIKLTDPESVLVHIERFCNIWVGLPLLACLALGCAPVLGPPGQICFLISCKINVCNLGRGVVHCIYWCRPT